MASWVDAIMSPLKAAGDMAQGLIEIRDTVKFGDAIIKLQAQIMSAYQGAATAQARETAMSEEMSRLKARVTELERWEVEKERYQLQRHEPGVFVYALKPDMAKGEPAHEICQACYQRGQKSILNCGEQHYGVTKLHCPSCSWSDHIGHEQPLPSPRGGSWMGA